jgi:hypothetical protein
MGSSPPVVEEPPTMVEDVPPGFEPIAAHRNQRDGAGARPATSSASLVVDVPPAMVFDPNVKLEFEDLPPGFEAVTAAPRNQGDGAGARAAASSASRNNDSMSQTLVVHKDSHLLDSLLLDCHLIFCCNRIPTKYRSFTPYFDTLMIEAYNHILGL